MSNHLRRAWAIASFDLRDQLRQKVWRFLSLQPVFFLVFVVVLPSVFNEKPSSPTNITVAVQGTGMPAEHLASQLRAEHLKAVVSDNAHRDVEVKRAAIGLRVESEGSVVIEVATSRKSSRTAYGELRAALGRIATSSAPNAPPAPVVTHELLNKTRHGQQLSFGKFLPFYVMVQLLSVIGIGVQHLATNTAKRATEPLLVLPFSRAELALGKAMFAFVNGLFSLAALMVPVVIFDLLPFAVAGINVSFGPLFFVRLLLASITLLPVLAMLGVFAGSASRTPGEAGIVAMLTGLVPVLVAATLTFFVKSALPRYLLPIPVIGHQALLAEVARGTAATTDYLIVLVSSIVLAAALVAPSGWLLRRDRAVLRVAS